MNSHKTLDDYTREIVATYKSYELTGTKPWTHTIAARDLSYQLGSLTKALMQIDGERHVVGKSREELFSTVSDELADIFAEVLFIAHELNISLDDAWTRMISSDENKIQEQKR